MTTTNFGAALRSLREARGLSIRTLAQKIHFSHSMVGHIESGLRTASPSFAAAVDQHLHAGGLLVALHRDEQEGGDNVQRREIMAGLAGLIAAGSLAPTRTLEATRIGLVATLGETATVDDWIGIADDYGAAYLREAPAYIQQRLTLDLSEIRHAIEQFPRSTMHCVAARLFLLQGMATASTGDPVGSARWYRTADRFASVGGSEPLRHWVRGRIAFRRGYDVGDPDEVLRLANDVQSVEAHLAAAQAYALAGAGSNAVDALTKARRAYDATSETGPSTIFRLPPWRMTIASALVLARIGNRQSTQTMLRDIETVRLPRRWRAQATITEAFAVARGGDPDTGRIMADAAIADLPPGQRSRTIQRLADEVVACATSRQ